MITLTPGSADVLRTISTIKGLETLNNALIATDLVNELDVTTRTLTIFAPTNEAFAAMPAALRDNLLADPTALRNVLRYHVVVDRVTSADLVRLGRALTALGETVAITATATGHVKVNDATIIQADITASNGLIHTIDRVLLPASVLTGTNALTGTATTTATNSISAPVTSGNAVTTTNTITSARVITVNTSNLTIAQVVSATPELRTLGVALQSAGITGTLQQAGPFTLFAPTNEAFASVPNLTNLLNTPTTLLNVVQYHIVADRVTAADLARLGVALSIQGQSITVTVAANGGEKVNNATIIQRDILASNGVIHVINGVLIPPSQ